MTNRYRIRTVLFTIVALLVFSLPSNLLWADSMRCGQKLVRSGDSPSVLLGRCGEPRHRGKGYAQIRTDEGFQKVRVDQWFYKKNERSLERIVMIYRGEIVRIETGGR